MSSRKPRSKQPSRRKLLNIDHERPLEEDDLPPTSKYWPKPGRKVKITAESRKAIFKLPPKLKPFKYPLKPVPDRYSRYCSPAFLNDCMKSCEITREEWLKLYKNRVYSKLGDYRRGLEVMFSDDEDEIEEPPTRKTRSQKVYAFPDFEKYDEYMMKCFPSDAEEDAFYEQYTKNYLDKTRVKFHKGMSTELVEGLIVDDCLPPETILLVEDVSTQSGSATSDRENESNSESKNELNQEEDNMGNNDIARSTNHKENSILLSLLTQGSQSNQIQSPEIHESSFDPVNPHVASNNIQNTSHMGNVNNMLTNEWQKLFPYKHILGNRVLRVALSRLPDNGSSYDKSKKGMASNYVYDVQKDKKLKLLPDEQLVDNHIVRVSVMKLSNDKAHINFK